MAKPYVAHVSWIAMLNYFKGERDVHLDGLDHQPHLVCIQPCERCGRYILDNVHIADCYTDEEFQDQ